MPSRQSVISPVFQVSTKMSRRFLGCGSPLDKSWGVNVCHDASHALSVTQAQRRPDRAIRKMQPDGTTRLLKDLKA
ncbi:hypothetical protein VTO42DRAFT_5154 [Malbranchea cinnamomea]